MANRKQGARRLKRGKGGSNLSLLNFKISDADRKLFRRMAENVTNGNVSALILLAVKTASISKLRAAS